MTILLITGKSAEKRVAQIAQKYGAETYSAPVEVASFITPEMISEKLEKIKGYDMIIVPGLLKGDISLIEKSTGIPTYRGPKDISDLELVLKNLDSIELSKEYPADEQLHDLMYEEALKAIKKTESAKYKEKYLKKPGNLLIGDLPVGRNFPMRVLAEVVSIDEKSPEIIQRRGEYFKKSGADIIDLGIKGKDPDKVEESINSVKELGLPVSIDTMEPENIERALDTGVDLVLSFNHELLKQFEGVKTPSVVLPMRSGKIPLKADQRVQLLEEHVQFARDRGFKNPVADPVLKPVNFGFTDSINSYKLFGDRNTGPILFGVGNVTELFDADSVGMNALLAAIAWESGASILFTPEDSSKTMGSVRELSAASKMMYLSTWKKSLPKDLGLDLLVLKEKQIKRDQLPEELLNVERIREKEQKVKKMDKKGYFKIYVENKIYCAYYKGKNPELLIEGYNAREISEVISGKNLVSDYSHALYLGRELQKAEEALRYNRSYIQA